METMTKTGLWECATCGRDNPAGKLTCILCGESRDGRKSAEQEAEDARQLILTAERDLTREMGFLVRLRVHGRVPPATVAEAEELIEETRNLIRQQAEEGELRTVGGEWTPESGEAEA